MDGDRGGELWRASVDFAVYAALLREVYLHIAPCSPIKGRKKLRDIGLIAMRLTEAAGSSNRKTPTNRHEVLFAKAGVVLIKVQLTCWRLCVTLPWTLPTIIFTYCSHTSRKL